MKKTVIILILAMMASLGASAQGCDTVQLPYSSNFTQCWSAVDGATISDSCHATLATRGDRLVSPCFEADSGSVYVHLAYDMDDSLYYYANTILFNIIYEKYNDGADTIPFWGIYNDACAFYSEGGLYRIVVEYVGNDTMPDLPLNKLAIFQYNIEIFLTGVPDTAYVGDTSTITISVTLPDGDTFDTSDYRNIVLWEMTEWAEGQYGWQGYGINLVPEYFYDNRIDSICNLVSHTDSSVTLVWRRPDHYQLSGQVYKNNVFESFYAWESSLWRSDEGVYVFNRSGIRGVQSNGISVGSDGCNITVKGAAGESVAVFDITGRQIVQKIDSNDIETFKVPAAGVYIVKVGNLPARKIVVVR